MFPVYLVEISQGMYSPGSQHDSAQLRYINITLLNTAWHSPIVKNCTPRVSCMPLTHVEGLPGIEFVLREAQITLPSYLLSHMSA